MNSQTTTTLTFTTDRLMAERIVLLLVQQAEEYRRLAADNALNGLFAIAHCRAVDHRTLAEVSNALQVQLDDANNDDAPKDAA